jgi:alkylation response protein AidB-like acyl-CoA dehydrogenase
LTGQKTFITNAPYAELFVIYARVEDKIAPFVLERGEGLTTSTPFDKMGHRSSPTGAIYLDGAPGIPLGGDVKAGGGRRGVVESLLNERVGLCAMGVGIMERSLQIALDYAQQRQQFGQPIAMFQAVQLRLARMYAAVATGRALLEQCHQKARAGEKDLALSCAAKLVASELATEVALEAVQVLGGNGYMSEYRVEMLARDAKLLEIGGGTSDIQLLTIARELLTGAAA